jgi:hypothetical protein
MPAAHDGETISLQEAVAFPIALQSKTLLIRC